MNTMKTLSGPSQIVLNSEIHSQIVLKMENGSRPKSTWSSCLSMTLKVSLKCDRYTKQDLRGFVQESETEKGLVILFWSSVQRALQWEAHSLNLPGEFRNVCFWEHLPLTQRVVMIEMAYPSVRKAVYEKLCCQGPAMHRQQEPRTKSGQLNLNITAPLNGCRPGCHS